jgi:hypothetical protein
MSLDSIYEFEIPGHSTRREWAVYVIIAVSSDGRKLFYVGKVGDNRDGCNPIISRIGNHLSHNKIHSQLRNKLDETANYNYRVFYSVFGKYDKNNHERDRLKINEIERRLNLLIQSKISNQSELINPYKGVGVSNNKKAERLKLLTVSEIDQIKNLAAKVCSLN